MKTVLKFIFLFTAIVLLSVKANGQLSDYSFGKGLHVYGKDSSFHMKFGLRFQNLFSNQWNVNNDNFSDIGKYQAHFMIRRARFKFDGFAHKPRLKWKMELGLSNRDISGGNTIEHGNVARFILDAWVNWNFAGNFSLRVGQGKLPGNRERVISSGDLQFVDRSRLNSRFNLDRDFGLMLTHHFTIGKQVYFKEYFAFSQGEGRDVIDGFHGGFDYTFRLECLPFGEFTSRKGHYVGSDLKRESKPKLAVGVSYDINDNAVRERGQLGAFIRDANGLYVGKTLHTLFIDMMFKYKGFSVMAEYADKKTADNDARVTDEAGNQLDIFYTGKGINIQGGYLLKSDIELGMRYTGIRPNGYIGLNENEFGLVVSKYFVGHKLKVQTDLNYRQKYIYGSSLPNNGSNDRLYWRVQMDIHF